MSESLEIYGQLNYLMDRFKDDMKNERWGAARHKAIQAIEKLALLLRHLPGDRP